MPVNESAVGKEFASATYEVGREKIREYANATGVHDPQYQAEDGGVVAPPMFAACFTVIRGGGRMFADPELGGHFALVHGSQEFEFHRPVRLGDVLECTPQIADIQWKGGNEFLTLQIDCNDARTGEPVATSRGVIVFLGSAPQEEEAS